MSLTNMKKYFCGQRGVRLLLGMLIAAVPLAAGTARIYVANRGGTTIDVIDPATNKVVEVIKGIESPEVIRFSPDGSRLYITSGARTSSTLGTARAGRSSRRCPSAAGPTMPGYQRRKADLSSASAIPARKRWMSGRSTSSTPNP